MFVSDGGLLITLSYITRIVKTYKQNTIVFFKKGARNRTLQHEIRCTMNCFAFQASFFKIDFKAIKKSL